jgi:16S rRNA C1402 N4-methylase RsmH
VRTCLACSWSLRFTRWRRGWSSKHSRSGKVKLANQAIKKACEPSEQELNENSRSQSAKLYSFLF